MTGPRDETRDEHPCSFVVDGKRYHHVAGFMAAMRHRDNPEFFDAVRREPDAALAMRMADTARIEWVDMDLGKRPLTDDEIRRYERDRERLHRIALTARRERLMSDPSST